MPYINEKAKEITFKIVYYGPGFAGKYKSFQFILQSQNKRIQTSMYFDRALHRINIPTFHLVEERMAGMNCITISLGKWVSFVGYRLLVHLETIPGPVFHKEQWKELFTDVDGIVFVADSQQERIDSNIVCKIELENFLKQLKLNIDEIPVVLQINKQDLPNKLDINLIKKDLFHKNIPIVPSIAINGQGVIESFRTVLSLVLKNFRCYIISSMNCLNSICCP